MKTGSFITYSCKWISPKKIIFFASMSVEMASSGSPLWSRLEGRASSTWRRTMTGRRRRRSRRSGASGERRKSGNVNILTFFVDQLHRLGELHQFHRWHHLHQHWGFICVGFVYWVKKIVWFKRKRWIKSNEWRVGWDRSIAWRCLVSFTELFQVAIVSLRTCCCLSLNCDTNRRKQFLLLLVPRKRWNWPVVRLRTIISKVNLRRKILALRGGLHAEHGSCAEERTRQEKRESFWLNHASLCRCRYFHLSGISWKLATSATNHSENSLVWILSYW